MILCISEMILISKSINQKFKRCIWFKLQLIRFNDYWSLKQNAFFNLFQLSLEKNMFSFVLFLESGFLEKYDDFLFNIFVWDKNKEIKG